MTTTYHVAQGSAEWHAVRLGIPTASQAHRIMTPAKREPSRQAEEYARELAFERVTGEAADTTPETYWMLRGRALEPVAREWYSLVRCVDVEEVGHVVRDGFGASPDGLVGAVGQVEIKVPAGKNHVGHLLDPERFRIEHKSQVQAAMWATQREWCDLMSYSPVLPDQVVTRIEPDQQWVEAWEVALSAFMALVAEIECRLRGA